MLTCPGIRILLHYLPIILNIILHTISRHAMVPPQAKATSHSNQAGVTSNNFTRFHQISCFRLLINCLHTLTVAHSSICAVLLVLVRSHVFPTSSGITPSCVQHVLYKVTRVSSSCICHISSPSSYIITSLL